MNFPPSHLQPSVADYDDSADYEDLQASPGSPTPRRSPPRVEQQPPRTDEQLSTFGGVVRIFMDHIECAIHTILHERDIYPRNLFMSTRKYGTAVKMCRVPKVNEYIRNVVDMLGEQLLHGIVQVVSIVILTSDSRPLERFNFDVSTFPEVDKRKIQRLLVHEGHPNDEINLPGTTLQDLNEQYRAVMTQLSVCSAKLGKLPEDCTWSVMVEMKERQIPVNHTKGWVVSDRQGIKGKTKGALAGYARDGSTMTPLRTVESGALSMQVWIEESNIKQKLPIDC